MRVRLCLRLIAAAALAAAPGLSASAADPLLGLWKTASGETAAIDRCGSAVCITLKTGKHAGRQIGRLSGSAPDDTGEMTDPANEKTYSGSATLAGATLKLKGCVLKVLCRSQSWTPMEAGPHP